MSETELITALKEGQIQAFNTIWKNHYRPLVYFVERQLGTNLISDDVAAQTFEKLWEKRSNFDTLPQIKSFLYITSKNKCIDHVRSIAIHTRIHDEIEYLVGEHVTFSPEENYDSNYEHYVLALNKKMERLPPGCRTIFKLYFYNNLATREIARRLRIAEQTVRNQKRKAVQLLRTA